MYLSNTNFISKESYFWGNSRKIIIIIIIIIIITIIIFMQGIYTYIRETKYVPREYSAAAILLLLFMVLISLLSVLYRLYLLLLLLLLRTFACYSRSNQTVFLVLLNVP